MIYTNLHSIVCGLISISYLPVFAKHRLLQSDVLYRAKVSESDIKQRLLDLGYDNLRVVTFLCSSFTHELCPSSYCRNKLDSFEAVMQAHSNTLPTLGPKLPVVAQSNETCNFIEEKLNQQ